VGGKIVGGEGGRGREGRGCAPAEAATAIVKTVDESKSHLKRGDIKEA